MISEIWTTLLYVFVCFVIAFIIVLPIMTLYFYIKLKKIIKNIPDDIQKKINSEKIFHNQMKGGYDYNDIKEEIRKTENRRGEERTNFGNFGQGRKEFDIHSQRTNTGRTEIYPEQQRRIQAEPAYDNGEDYFDAGRDKRDTKKDWPSFD
jgi:hypothetical protein